MTWTNSTPEVETFQHATRYAQELKLLLDEVKTRIAALDTLFGSTTAAEVATLAGVTAGSVTASKELVAGAQRQLATLGALTADGAQATTITNASATPGNTQAIVGAFTTGLTLTSGTVKGVRGLATVTASTSVGSGVYVYGTQGKVVADNATIDVGSAHVAGLLGQLSGSSLTPTSGHIAMVIASGQNLPTSDKINAIYCESGGGTINAVLQSNVKATYFLDVNNFESCGIVATPAGAVASGNLRTLKVQIDGATYYILAAAGFGS